MIDFSDFCTEIFQILRAYGRDLVLYDEQGNRVYEPADARRFYMLGENILLSIHEDGDNSSLKLYLSNSVNLNQANGFIEMLRNIAIKSNLLFHVKKFDKEIKPQDFATRASVNEQENVNMNLMEGLYGTSKSSYLKLESARMIVRHSAKVNENMIGSRGRNIQAIFVENALGERFLFPVNMLSGGRAMTQHVNQGGTFADEVGQQIIRMAQDFRNLARVQQHGKTDAVTQPEVYASVQESILESMKTIKRSFGRVYETKSYGRETGRLVEAASLMEDSENLQEAVESWIGVLGEGIEREAVLSLARLVKLPEAQEPVIEDFADEVDSDDESDDMVDDAADDVQEGVEDETAVGGQIDLTVEGTTEQEALECSNNSVIKKFNEWMEGFAPENFLEGKTFKDQKDDEADVGRKKKEDKNRRQERDNKRKPVEESAGDVVGWYVDKNDRHVAGPMSEVAARKKAEALGGDEAGYDVSYVSDYAASRMNEGKSFKHNDDGDDDGSDPKGKKKEAKKKREEKKEKRSRTDEDQSLDMWKNQVKAAHPEVAGKLKFKGRNEGGKTLVSAEIDGEDRSYGVFDMGDEKGEVLEGKLKEFDMGDNEPSVHDLKSQLMAADIKLRSLSPFSPDYGKTLMLKKDLEAKLKGTSRYGRPVAENMFPDNDDDYQEDDVSDLIAKYSKDGYEVRRVPQHELNNADMYRTLYRAYDMQAGELIGTFGSEADAWRTIDDIVKSGGAKYMEGKLNEFELDLDSDDTAPEDGNVHDVKSQLAQAQADLSKMNAFSPMYGQVMRKRDELQAKLKGMSRYGKAVAEDWADGDLMAEDDAVFTDEEEGLTETSGETKATFSGHDQFMRIANQIFKKHGLTVVSVSHDGDRGTDEYVVSGTPQAIDAAASEFEANDDSGAYGGYFLDEGLVEASDKPLIRDDGWFQIDAEVQLDSDDMADYEAQFADLGYLVDRDYEWSIASGDDMPDGIIIRSDAMRTDDGVLAMLGEIHGPGAYANFDDAGGDDDYNPAAEDKAATNMLANLAPEVYEDAAAYVMKHLKGNTANANRELVTRALKAFFISYMDRNDVYPETDEVVTKFINNQALKKVAEILGIAISESSKVIPANQQTDFKKDVQSPNNDDETYVNRIAQLAGLKR